MYESAPQRWQLVQIRHARRVLGDEAPADGLKGRQGGDDTQRVADLVWHQELPVKYSREMGSKHASKEK